MRIQYFSIPFFALILLFILTACTNTEYDSTSQLSNDPITSTVSVVKAVPIQTSIITKSVTYGVDHQKHQVTTDFIITMSSDGKINSVVANMISGDHESLRYHNRFNNNAQSKIVGKKVSELSLSGIGGASDTTSAFNKIIQSL